LPPFCHSASLSFINPPPHLTPLAPPLYFKNPRLYFKIPLTVHQTSHSTAPPLFVPLIPTQSTPANQIQTPTFQTIHMGGGTPGPLLPPSLHSKSTLTPSLHGGGGRGPPGPLLPLPPTLIHLSPQPYIWGGEGSPGSSPPPSLPFTLTSHPNLTWGGEGSPGSSPPPSLYSHSTLTQTLHTPLPYPPSHMGGPSHHSFCSYPFFNLHFHLHSHLPMFTSYHSNPTLKPYTFPYAYPPTPHPPLPHSFTSNHPPLPPPLSYTS